MRRAIEAIMEFTVSPWIGFLSLLVAVLGIFCTVHFFLKSRKRKKPRYALRSTNLVRDFTNQLDALEMTYEAQRISNLTVSRLAFWNEGRDTIDSSDVAEADPLLIITKDDSEVLDCSVLSTTSEANRMRAKRCEDRKSIKITFDFLDQGEGGVVQILHTGQSSSDLVLEGTVKGAGHPRRLNTNIPAGFLLRFSDHISVRARRRILVSMLFITPILLPVAQFLPETESSNSDSLRIIMSTLLSGLYWFTAILVLKRRVPRGFELFEEET